MSTTKKYKKLQPDGAYTSEHGKVCAYSDFGLKRKDDFLRNARALLVEVGQHLAAHGLTAKSISRNPGGMAVSGEVYAEFWSPDTPTRHVYVTIGESITDLSGRRDHLSIMARLQPYREPAAHEKPRRSRRQRQKEAGPALVPCPSGANQWLSPEHDSFQLAEALLRIYNPEQTPRIVAVHALSTKTPIPLTLVVERPEDMLTALTDRRRVEQALARDQAEVWNAPELPLFQVVADPPMARRREPSSVRQHR